MSKIIFVILIISTLFLIFGCIKTNDYVEEGSSLKLQFKSNECSYNKYNCSDFSSQKQAQKIFKQCPTDVHDLDRDNDGLACE
jgi:hypothetical protein